MNSASWFATSWAYVVASAQRYLAGKYGMSEDDYKAYMMDLGVFDGVGAQQAQFEQVQRRGDGYHGSKCCKPG